MQILTIEQDGKERCRMSLNSIAIVRIDGVEVRPPSVVSPPEPETFDWEHIKRTPGVWMSANLAFSDFRIVRGKHLESLTLVSVGDPTFLAVPTGDWLHARFIPAPERLEDLRVTFSPPDVELRGLLEEAADHIDFICREFAIPPTHRGFVDRVRTALGKSNL